MSAALILSLCAWLPGTKTSDDPSRHEFRRMHMGSEFKIVIYTMREAEARRASDSAFARITALDKALSDYDPESELMRLCDRAGGPPVAVSDDLFRCLELSQAMSEQSGGAFDCTIGPIGRLWRRSRRDGKLPEPALLAKAREAVGYRNIVLDPAKKTVQLLKLGMKLDLGGIAKGFACDEAMAALKRAGITSALVGGAGDIAVSGPPPGETGWRIGVASPDGDPAHPLRFISLKNAAVSTAGDADRFVVIGGKRYSHILDPKTGVGVVRRASVTVVARTCALSDSLDTAVYGIGPELGLLLIEKLDCSGLFVVAGEEPATYASRRWVEVGGLGKRENP